MHSEAKGRGLHQRRPCRGQILVHELTNGRRSVGDLIDDSPCDVRLALDHGLRDDEVIELLFSSKSDNKSTDGRMIIGHVVQSKPAWGRHIVRVAFGWDAATHEASRPVRKDSQSLSVYRPFSKRVTSLVTTA